MVALASRGKLIRGHARRRGQLTRAGRPSEPRGELLADPREACAGLLQPPRQADGVGPVAEVPLHLPGNGRHREGGELVAELQVEALDRVQEADRAGLSQVIVLGTAPFVPMRQSLDKRHVELDQAFPGARIALFSIGTEKPASGRVSVGSCLPCRWSHPGGWGHDNLSPYMAVWPAVQG